MKRVGIYCDSDLHTKGLVLAQVEFRGKHLERSTLTTSIVRHSCMNPQCVADMLISTLYDDQTNEGVSVSDIMDQQSEEVTP